MGIFSKRATVTLYIRYFLFFLTPPLILLALFFWHDFHATEEYELDGLKTRERYRISESVKLLNQILFGPMNNVHSLTIEEPNIAAFHMKSRKAQTQEVAESLISLMYRNPDYMQARWIDLSGHEIVRINRTAGKVVRVAEKDLQEKAHRPYVERTLQLKENQVYVSVLDLNIEHGEIERPLNPTLRFGAKIFLSDGSSPGIFIINYSARKILHELRGSDTGEHNARRYLINQDGQWIRGPSTQLEWGHILGHNATFSDYAPDVWQKIQASKSGQSAGAHGIWTWRTLSPGRARISSVIRESWVVLGLIQHTEVAGIRQQVRDKTLRRSLMILSLIVLLSLIGAYVQVKRREAMADLAQRMQQDLEDKAKSEFLANMSHEIRTPMNAVIGLVQVLAESSLTSYQQDLTNKIRNAAEALLNILNDILDYSKIEAGQLTLSPVPMAIDDIFRKVSDLFSVAASMKGIELLFSYGRAVPADIEGDAQRLTQVLSNLVGNAVKFTSHGHIRVSVQVAMWQSSKVRLRFAVEDTGIGMNKEQITRIFTPFVQADSSTSRTFGGSGLGLSICRRLVEMMNGEISVESQPGLGSTFSFEADFVARTASALVRSSQLEHKRVLIIDAHDGIRAELEKLLHYWGMETVAFESVKTALACVQEHDVMGTPFDFLIVDFNTLAVSHDPLFTSINGVIENTRLVQPFAILLVSPYQSADLAQYPSVSAVLRKPVLAATLFENLVMAGADEKIIARFALSGPGRKTLYERAEPLHGARVLLVEDNLLNQEVASSLLRKMGLLVEIANNGLEAVEMIEGQSFDAVLMDLQMPVMDGFDATEIIRKKPCGRALPIIAMTAAVFDSDRVAAIERGMNDHIGKPIDASVLLDSLLSHVKQTGAVSQTGAASPTGEGTQTGAGSPAAREKDGVADPADAVPDSLPEMNLEAALARLSGEKSLLYKVLRRFVLDYAGWESKIRAAISERRVEEAIRLAHTLKGAAGTIGAETLQASVGSLEAELKGGRSGNCDDVCNALLRVLESLQIHLTAVPPPSAGAPVQLEEARTEIKHIEAILTRHGVVGDEMVLALTRSLGGLSAGSEVSELLEQIDIFDYDGALRSLERLKELVEDAGKRV